jgi:PHD/YefM family antitoxin component YafN of YafNO toxin-antitoxin module
MSIREFRASTGQLKELLASKENVVLTSNGKPTAIIIDANEENFENTLRDIRLMKAKRAIESIQKHAENNGLDKMTLEEINQLVYEDEEENYLSEL